MKFASTAALRAAILCSAAIAVSACAYEGPHRMHGGATVTFAGDPCETDHSYCGYPTYEGGVYVEGNWYDGHYRYRDQDGKRCVLVTAFGHIVEFDRQLRLTG